MGIYRKTALVVTFLLIAGLLRMPLERPLGREMRQSSILAKPLDAGTSEALGQTSAAIALGGLRSLVAATLNFSKVVTSWQNQDWLSIFNTFQQIHTLQPQVSYYWEAAASYAADDAYADYRDRPGLVDSQRTLRRDELFRKGVAYLDEGITNIPESQKLYELKARFLSDTYKPDHLDYAAAAEVLDEAVQLPKATDVIRRQRLYLMTRVPERRKEALGLAHEIFSDPESRFPSVKSILFALQNEFPAEGAIPEKEIYPSEIDLIRSLFNYYQRRNENFPVKGVQSLLEERLAKLELPLALNPLQNHDIKRVTLKIAQVMAHFPLELSEDPFAEASDWPMVVDHFQEYGSQSLPTMRVLFFVLQNIAQVEDEKRVSIAGIFPNLLIRIRDLANYQLDQSHALPRNGVQDLLESSIAKAELPSHLNPLEKSDLFPLNREWMTEVTEWQFQQVNSGLKTLPAGK